jgi:hypothetical protein
MGQAKGSKQRGNCFLPTAFPLSVASLGLPYLPMLRENEP